MGGHNRKKLEFSINENLCFTVISHKIRSDGYAQLFIENKLTLAHRFVYEQCFEEIPEGLVVRHTCDNRACINPEHLELGTHIDNMGDMVLRGRSMRGQNHTNASLTEEDVLNIRASELTQKELGQKYGVNFSTIGKIKRREKWKHI